MAADVVYAIEDLDIVIRHWVKDYEPGKGRRVTSHEWWVDPVKKKVIIRLIVLDTEG